MTEEMVIKWLKWIKNCFIPGSEQEKAIDLAISLIESKEKYSKEYVEKQIGKVRELQLQLLKEPMLIQDAYNQGWAEGIKAVHEKIGKDLEKNFEDGKM